MKVFILTLVFSGYGPYTITDWVFLTKPWCKFAGVLTTTTLPMWIDELEVSYKCTESYLEVTAPR